MFYFWLAAEDNLAFTLGWFAKFPEYKKNKFYLTGESFSGTPQPPKKKPSACLQDLGVSY
jgi:carboxypeptidase C (cathepsin A)